MAQGDYNYAVDHINEFSNEEINELVKRYNVMNQVVTIQKKEAEEAKKKMVSVAEYKINKKIEGKEHSFKKDLVYHWVNQKEYVRLVNIAKEDSSAMMPSLYKREFKDKATHFKNSMKRTLAEMIYLESLKGKASELNADQLDNSLRDTVVRDAVHEIVNSDVFKCFFKKLDGIKLYENGKNMDMPQLMEVVNKEYKSFEKSLANDKDLNKEEIQIKK